MDDDEARRPFLSEPWCAKLLSEPGLTVEVPPSRIRQPDGEEDLFAKTLNTRDTIAGYLLLYRAPESSPEAEVQEILSLFKLGRALISPPETLHGGIMATLLDEVTGSLLTVNQLRNAWPMVPCVTAYLNTTFLRPVPTPGFVLCRARMSRKVGRKIFVAAVIEDGDGNELAKGEALYVLLRLSTL